MRLRALFLHGGPGYRDYLEPYFSAQFPTEFECVFYSQNQDDSVSVASLVEEVGQLLSTTMDTVLIGHSWGGALAIEYLRQRSDPRVKAIVLIGSYLCAEDATTEYRKEIARLGLTHPTTEQVFFTSREARAAGDLIQRLDSSFNRAVFKNVWDEFAPSFDAREFVSTLTIPILNIFGEKDIRIPSHRVRTYAELNSKIKNLEIKDAGHFPFITTEDRAYIATAIRELVHKVNP